MKILFRAYTKEEGGVYRSWVFQDTVDLKQYSQMALWLVSGRLSKHVGKGKSQNNLSSEEYHL